MFKRALNKFDTTTLYNASGELTSRGWVYLIVAAHIGILVVVTMVL